MSSDIPEICDWDCPHADFPPAETAGICRTMAAVWCKKLKELVNKNLPCEYHQRSRSAAHTKPRKNAISKKSKKTATTRRVRKNHR